MALLTFRVLEENSKSVQNSIETGNSSSSGKLFRPWAGFVDSKSELKSFEKYERMNVCNRVLPSKDYFQAQQDSTVSTTTPSNNLQQKINNEVSCEKVTQSANFSTKINNNVQHPKSTASKTSQAIDELKTGSHKSSRKVDICEKKSKRLAEHSKAVRAKNSAHSVDQSLINCNKISACDANYPAYSAYDISGIPQLCCSDVAPCGIPLTHISNRTQGHSIDMTMLSGMIPGIDTVLPPELVSNFDFALSQGLLSPLTTVEEYARLFQDQQKNSNKKQRPKKYKCPHCQVAFSNNGQLKGHVRIHTGERPFKCDVESCGKTFTRNEELTRHKRIHSGVRPYPCSSCGKRFGRKDHLKKHSRTHQVHHRLIPLHMPFIHPYPYPYGY